MSNKKVSRLRKNRKNSKQAPWGKTKAYIVKNALPVLIEKIIELCLKYIGTFLRYAFLLVIALVNRVPDWFAALIHWFSGLF